MTVFRPPNYVPAGRDTRIIFLGGPIQGAEDWQANAIDILHRTMGPDTIIASPRSGMWSKDLPEAEKQPLYMEQLHWEHVHLDRALHSGVVMFWLAKESDPIPGRAYAQTSRIELGAILGYKAGLARRKLFIPRTLMMPIDSLVVGADSEFSGRRYIRELVDHHGRALHSSLEKTCSEAALRLGQIYRP